MQNQNAIKITRLQVFAILFLTSVVSFSYSNYTTVSTTICAQKSPCQLTSIPSQINKTSVGQAVNIVGEIVQWVMNLFNKIKSYL